VTADVRLLEIEPDGGPVPYPPGSHLQVRVLVGEVPDVRSYSLVGEPDGEVYRIGVRLDPDGRGGSRYLHQLEAGHRLQVSEPRSHFPLGWGSPEYLLVAGGIGITALFGMASVLSRKGSDVRLVFAGRSRGHMPFVPELAELLGPRLELRVGDEGTRLDLAAEIARLHPQGELYLCGPLRMREEAQRIWQQQGRPVSKLRFETFASSGSYAAQDFLVEVVDTGDQVPVPAGTTMLEALERAGIEVMSDCLRGECGLCVVRLHGTTSVLDHRDVFLSDRQKAEGTKMAACVSRAVGGTVRIDSSRRPDPTRVTTPRRGGTT
jgi:vanillate O-demethylase ferredoxin subunit